MIILGFSKFILHSHKQYADTSGDWRLILVDKNHYIPKDYQMNLTRLSNGKQVDSRIYPSLQKMFNDARESGLALFVREGYRTFQDQKQIMDEKIRAYENQGNSKHRAARMAEKYVAIPGTSEHQLVSYILTGNEDYNPSVYLNVNPKKLLNIYKIREAKIQKLIQQNGKTEKQRKYLKEKYDKISTPYQYEAPDSWDTMQLYVVTYLYSIFLILYYAICGKNRWRERNLVNWHY